MQQLDNIDINKVSGGANLTETFGVLYELADSFEEYAVEFVTGPIYGIGQSFAEAIAEVIMPDETVNRVFEHFTLY